MFGDVSQARTNAAMLLLMIATTSSHTCTKPILCLQTINLYCIAIAINKKEQRQIKVVKPKKHKACPTRLSLPLSCFYVVQFVEPLRARARMITTARLFFLYCFCNINVKVFYQF